MVRLFSFLAIFGTILLLFSAPWLAALSYTTVSIMQPQYVWFWSFDGFPIFKITAGLAIIAWVIQAMQKRIDGRIYKDRVVIALPALWLIYQVSMFFSPFTNDGVGAGPAVVMNTLDIITLMFLIVIGLIRSAKALETFAIVMIATAVYYTYWANTAYLTSDYSKFEAGRLMGPRGSPYRDGNDFSILFVITMPFVLFGIFYFKSRVVRLILIAALPLLWHGIVLCSSRGALLSISVATLFAAFMVKSKMLNVGLAVGFVIFMIFQGGPIISRSLDTTRAADENPDQPINPRVLSWLVGVELIKRHPILGVGPQQFRLAANTYYPGATPHVAHNTFLNFAANTGVFAGFIYLFFFYRAFKMYRHDRWLAPPGSVFEYLNKACACALVGFFVGALFLDLIIFEPFYFVMLLMVANHYNLAKEIGEPAGASA